MLRNSTPEAKLRVQAMLPASMTFEYSSLRNGGVRCTERPEEVLERCAIQTVVIDDAVFGLDGLIYVHAYDEWLTLAEFHTLYRENIVEHITEHAKSSAANFRRFLSLEMAQPVRMTLSYCTDEGVHDRKVVARTREQVLDWCKSKRLAVLNLIEESVAQ